MTSTGFDRIAAFVLAKPTSIPQSARNMAALLLADTLGVAAGAHDLEAARIAREFAIAQFAAGDDRAARLLFDGRKASPAGAAFALASQIDNLDAHDGYNPTKGHIGCAVVPALFALATPLEKLSGTDALDALVISYEVAARAALALHSTVTDYHTSGAWNGLGVVAMGCRLGDMNAETLRQALGIAEYHGPRSQMMREIANPTMLHDGSGMGALTGMMAIDLARRGFTGAPALTVEEAQVDGIWSDLGHRWTIEENYIKPYPICRWAHAAIDATRALCLEHGFGADDVEQLTVRTFAEAAQLYPGMPETTSQAQYSLRFAVATMLRHGRIGASDVAGDALQDQQTAKILSHITIEEDERHSRRFPEGRWSDVQVVLKDGRSFVSGDVHARGGPEAPMTHDDIREKFLRFAGPVGEQRAQSCWEVALGLGRDKTLFRELADLVEAAI